MNLFFLFVVLLQTWTALGTRCRTNEKKLGICKPLNDCNVMYDMSRLLARCGSTGLHCCPPSESTVSLPISSTTPSSNEETVPLLNAGSKFPTDCGNTPIYSKPQIVGGIEIQPDQYSWLASLQYGNKSTYGSCGGSVINARYVVTAAHCVTGGRITNAGGLTGLRLGDFRSNETICDYGTENCRHYHQFGIEKIIVHSGYKANSTHILNDIALVRVDRPIQFGPKMKPICLPFEGNNAEEPAVGSVMTVAGWGLTMEENEKRAKRAVSILIWETDKCNKVFHVDGTHLCAAETGKNSCNGDSGGPLMYEFAKRKMVLEGIVSYGVIDCRDNKFPGVYTRVRNFYNWMNQQMEM